MPDATKPEALRLAIDALPDSLKAHPGFKAVTRAYDAEIGRLRARLEAAEPVGIASKTRYQGATAAIFDSWKVPHGTKLYAAPVPASVPDGDSARVDALSRPGWELGRNSDPECSADEMWQIHVVSGGRNDREWTLIGEGATPRQAIDSAMLAAPKQAEGGNP